jgi:hypothetical protein
VIDSFAPIDPALIDVVLPEDEQGYPEHEMLADREPGVLWDYCGAASRKMRDELRVESKEWVPRAKENDANRTWPTNYRDRYTNQGPGPGVSGTHECVYHSLDANYSMARNRHRAIRFPDGPKKNFRYEESALGSVWMSPQSGYCRVTPKTRRNPQQRGGSNVRQSLETITGTGWLPDKIQPRDYGFKHTLHGTSGIGNNNQSRGPYISPDDLPEGWEETAKHFRALEAVFPESFEDAVSLLLNGFGVSVGRNGHAITWSRLIFEGARLVGAAYDDSYDITRVDSVRTMRNAISGSFSIITTTQPDDWLKPAG